MAKGNPNWVKKPVEEENDRAREARPVTNDESVPQRPATQRQGQLWIPPQYIKPGYVPYLAIDKPGNIERMEGAGWEFIYTTNTSRLNSEDATQMGSKFTTPAGNGSTYYGMQIRKEWYDEIKAEERAEGNISDNPILTDSPTGSEIYIPDGKASVLTTTIKDH